MRITSNDGIHTTDLFKEVVIDLGSNNTFHYYVMDYGKLEELAPGSMQGTEDGYLQRGIDQARIDKAKELNARLEELKSCFQPTDLTVPKVQTAADIDTSKLSNLTLQDLDGNQVKLGDIFAKNKVTMVDMWNTTCTVCVEDMPTLEKYSKDYANQGFGIVGVCCDVVDNNGEIDDDLLYNAQDIRKRTGITYPTVLADGTYRQLVEVTSTPTILYVDSEGNIIDGPSRGTYPEDIMRGISEGNIATVQ